MLLNVGDRREPFGPTTRARQLIGAAVVMAGALPVTLTAASDYAQPPRLFVVLIPVGLVAMLGWLIDGRRYLGAGSAALAVGLAFFTAERQPDVDGFALLFGLLGAGLLLVGIVNAREAKGSAYFLLIVGVSFLALHSGGRPPTSRPWVLGLLMLVWGGSALRHALASQPESPVQEPVPAGPAREPAPVRRPERDDPAGLPALPLVRAAAPVLLEKHVATGGNPAGTDQDSVDLATPEKVDLATPEKNGRAPSPTATAAPRRAAPAPVEPMEPERFQQLALAIEAELGRLVVGQSEVVRLVLIALIGQGHVLLEGVPGVGKTVLVRSLAEAVDLEFHRVQFTPDLMPADITGSHIVTEDDAGRRRFEFQPGPLFTNLLLADEINRASPKTQSALLEAMQERQVTTGNQTRQLSSPFFVLATQNPIELEGTYPLPEAQLDRFFFKLVVPFPDADDLLEIASRTTGSTQIAITPVVNGAELAAMATLARQVPCARHVMEHAVRIILATHPDRADSPEEVRTFVRFGCSPRGLQTLVLAGRVRALLDGRFNVSFEDLAAVALPALRHRIFLGFEAEASGIDPDAIVAAVLASVPQLVSR